MRENLSQLGPLEFGATATPEFRCAGKNITNRFFDTFTYRRFSGTGPARAVFAAQGI